MGGLVLALAQGCDVVAGLGQALSRLDQARLDGGDVLARCGKVPGGLGVVGVEQVDPHVGGLRALPQAGDVQLCGLAGLVQLVDHGVGDLQVRPRRLQEVAGLLKLLRALPDGGAQLLEGLPRGLEAGAQAAHLVLLLGDFLLRLLVVEGECPQVQQRLVRLLVEVLHGHLDHLVHIRAQALDVVGPELQVGLEGVDGRVCLLLAITHDVDVLLEALQARP
mmetsp:Transcript_76649/g.237358  ORF Transcript_76649/g.237358 Transcript_76649/m.237358 type:complete len:221 (+) Transcript_76649:383-1045(+)